MSNLNLRLLKAMNTMGWQPPQLGRVADCDPAMIRRWLNEVPGSTPPSSLVEWVELMAEFKKANPVPDWKRSHHQDHRITRQRPAPEVSHG